MCIYIDIVTKQKNGLFLLAFLHRSSAFVSMTMTIPMLHPSHPTGTGAAMQACMRELAEQETKSTRRRSSSNTKTHGSKTQPPPTRRPMASSSNTKTHGSKTLQKEQEEVEEDRTSQRQSP
jgi:hypothetical protein